jgi:hypothetical protein
MWAAQVELDEVADEAGVDRVKLQNSLDETAA